MHSSSSPRDGRTPIASIQPSPSAAASSRRRPRGNSVSQPPPSLAAPHPKRPRPDMDGRMSDVVDLTGPSAGPSAVALGKRPAMASAAFSATPSASAFQPQAGAKKLVIKNLRVAPASRAREMEHYYERTWADMEDAVASILDGRPPRQPLERLYRGVEDLCLHGQAHALYMKLRNQNEEHLQQVVLPQLRAASRAASNVDVLRALLQQWQIWGEKSTLLRSIFSYLDRAYVLNERSLQQINDMLIHRFRRKVFEAKGSDPSVQPPGQQAIQGMCELVDFDRRADDRFDGPLLRDAVAMAHVLGIYNRFFEPALLDCSERYLQVFVGEHGAADLTSYILAVESLLRGEDLRCNTYNLDSSTKKALLDMIQQQLVAKRVPALVDQASVARLLDGQASGSASAGPAATADTLASARALYDLLRMPRLQKQLRAPWEDYIESAGTAIVTDVAHGDTMVVRLLTLRRTLDRLVRDAFARDEDLAHGLRDAFGRFINGRAVAAAWPSGSAKVGELVAKHVDLLMRGGLKTLPAALVGDDTAAGTVVTTAARANTAAGADEDHELDRQLDQALELFRFVQGKDVFEAFYKKDLARRLLMGRSANQDAERSMLGKLKTECGAALTHNLEQMFRDQELSRDEMESYRVWCEALETSDDNDDGGGGGGGGGRGKSRAMDLHVSVLSSAAWPTYVDVPLRLPADVLAQVQRFDKYYKAKHTGRQLTWMHALGHCIVRARFDRGTKELLVSAFQAAVLMLFNQVEDSAAAASATSTASAVLTYDQIAAATGLEGANLDRTLQSLACGKVRVLSKHPRGRDVASTDTFTVNRGLTDPKFRIKINQIQLRETREENTATYERVTADRQFETQAAIVRIMKSRKTLPHAQLVAEVISQTRSRGALDPVDIKQNIEKLIEKDYLDREGGNYVYLA